MRTWAIIVHCSALGKDQFEKVWISDGKPVWETDAVNVCCEGATLVEFRICHGKQVTSPSRRHACNWIWGRQLV